LEKTASFNSLLPVCRHKLFPFIMLCPMALRVRYLWGNSCTHGTLWFQISYHESRYIKRKVIFMSDLSVARTCPSGQTAYTIAARDTFFTLSRRFGVTIQSIADANPGVSPNNLRIGQVICIPNANPGPPVCPAGSFSYTIVAGDTLFSLSQKFGVTTQSILALNPSINPNDLRVAQIICIPNAPTPPVCPANSFAYTIMTGDSVASIAQKFGVTAQSILDLNPGLDPANLTVGRQICIPGTMPSACTCEQNLEAANRNITLLRGESGAQIFGDMNYGTSTAKTVATLVTATEIRFDAAPNTFTGNFTCQFTQGTAYPFFMDSAAGGQRGLVVKDNFGIWHTFAFRVPIM
jgi:LysM repeat protein